MNKTDNGLQSDKDFDRDLSDYSTGLITGALGSGSTMLAKCQITSTLSKDLQSEVIILSTGNEYDQLAGSLNGQVVYLDSTGKTQINLLDLPDSESFWFFDDPMSLKSDLLISLFASLFPSLTEMQESIIDKVTIATYKKYESPTLLNWYHVLQEKEGIQSQDFVQKLVMYITYIMKSLDMFTHKTNVALHSHFVVYNINQLGDEFKPFAYIAIIEKICQHVIENQTKGIHTRVYIDDIDVILSKDMNALTRQMFQNILTRFRLYGGYLIGITRYIESVLATPEGRDIFFNSDFLILLKQNPEVVDLLVKALFLTDQQICYLKASELGTGLIVSENMITAF